MRTVLQLISIMAVIALYAYSIYLEIKPRKTK